MCNFYILIFSLMLPFGSWSQELSIIRVDTVNIPFTLKEQSNQLYLQYDTTKTDNSDSLISLLTLLILKLDHGDLRLNYHLSPLRKDFYYRVKVLGLSNLSKFPTTPKSYDLEGQFDTILLSKQQVIWQNILQNDLMYKQKHHLKIQYELYGKDVNCGSDPTFFRKKRDKIATFSLAGLGLGFLTTAALIQRPRYNDKYSAYQSFWAEGVNGEVLDSELGKAIKQQQNYKTLNNIGLGLLAADAFVFTLNLVNYNKRKKTYKQYCGNKK